MVKRISVEYKALTHSVNGKKQRKMKKAWEVRSIPAWNYLEYLVLRGFAGAVNLMSIGLSTRIARGVGNVLYWVLPGRRKVAFSNLEITYKDSLSPKEKEVIVRETFRNLCTSLMEFFRIPSMLAEAQDRFQFEGTEYIDEAFKNNKGIILAISHIGSWEYLAFLPYLRGYPCSVVVRPSKNPYIDKWIESLREKTKLKPIDKLSAAKKILKRLKQNELVAILTDQWAGHDGVWADFFGSPTSTTSIPARLAHRTNSIIIPAYCLRTSVGKYKIVICPPVEVPETEDYETTVTAKLNELLEAEIRKYPSQWSWAHKRWKREGRFLRNQ